MVCIKVARQPTSAALLCRERSQVRGRAPSVSGRIDRTRSVAYKVFKTRSTSFVPRVSFVRSPLPGVCRAKRAISRCVDASAPSTTEQEGDTEVVLKGERWDVRLARQHELKQVSIIQAKSFHEANPIDVLNNLFLGFFQAEVYSTLLSKSKWSKENRFACLTARAPAADAPIVGVAEVSIQGDQGVNKLLEVSEYCYVCCMAVDPACRRQSIATELLRGAELIAKRWGYNRLCLHVYDTNKSAQDLYRRSGYEVMSYDSAWEAALAGRPRRILLAKDVL